MKKFYVIHTKVKQEKKAERNLKLQGFKTWLPTYERSLRRKNQIFFTKEPFFPGYIFVIFDLFKDDWFKIKSTFGVKYLISTDGRPKALEDSTVLLLRKIINNQLLQLNDEVEINIGKLSKKKAKILSFCSKDRVELLLDSLSGKVTTILHKNSICKI